MIALEQNPSVILARKDIRLSEADLEVAKGEFDLRLDSQVNSELIDEDSTALVTSDDVSVGATVGLTRKLRNGMVLSPNISSTLIDNENDSDAPAGAAAINFEVLFPLLEGRGHGSAAANENAAKETVTAKKFLYRQQVSIQILRTLMAYWNSVASKDLLHVFQKTELRADEISKKVKKFVSSGLFSPGYVDQANAYSGRKKSLRIQQELILYQSQQELAIALGIQSEELPNTITPIDSLPEVVEVSVRDKEYLSVLIDNGLLKRDDYQAALYDIESLKILEEAAKIDSQPRLDFSLKLGYTGQDKGSSSYTSFPHELRGANVFGLLSLDWPFANYAKKGLLINRQLTREKAEVIRKQLSQFITSDILTSMRSVVSNSNEVNVSLFTEDMYRQALEKENKRFQIGESSLVDLLELEDRYTDARQTVIIKKRDYINALLQLRFATGTLINWDNDLNASIETEALYQLPTFEF